LLVKSILCFTSHAIALEDFQCKDCGEIAFAGDCAGAYGTISNCLNASFLGTARGTKNATQTRQDKGNFDNPGNLAFGWTDWLNDRGL
jgi:hypothetical protein